MPTCANCKDEKESGEKYITYGGLVWCDLDCLAEYYASEGIEVTDEKNRQDI
jgi:hypothetical protein